LKLAVIENEFGEVGVDDALLAKNTQMQIDEEIIEMMNGCICCTVRQDLVKVLCKLAKRQQSGKLKLDGIIIETTGLADPAPVAQTFFVDEEVKKFARLDGIVTLVDAKHIEQHLDEEKAEGVENEAVEQVAFADRLLLNKTDLVSKEDLERVEKRLKTINCNAPIIRCERSKVSVDSVLNINGFDLNRTLEMDPEFLNTEGEHQHDETVTSMGVCQSGDVERGLFEEYIMGLVRTKGNDIFRMKGVISVAHSEKRFVYHSVHMIFNGDFTDPWEEDEPRENRLVFIGKNLDHAELKKGFLACLATPANLDKKRAKLRFKVGEQVEMKTGRKEWCTGTVQATLHRDPDMPNGHVAPYQVVLEDGVVLCPPTDDDEFVRKPRGKRKA